MSKKQITDFKNDVLFKYLLCVNDKNTILDLKVITTDEQNIDIQMQNSSLTRQQYQRFQIYRVEILLIMKKDGIIQGKFVLIFMLIYPNTDTGFLEGLRHHYMII